MCVRKSRFGFLLLAAGVTLAALSLALATDAFSQNVRGGPTSVGPRLGNIGPMGPSGMRSPNFRLQSSTVDRPPTRPEGKPPRRPKGPTVVILPPGGGGPTIVTPPPSPPPPSGGGSSGPARRVVQTGVPPAGETRYVPDEVVIQVAGNPSPQVVDALARRFRLARIESLRLQLIDATVFRWRVPRGRSVSAAIRQLERSGAVQFASPNYWYVLSQSATASAPADTPLGDPAQYALGKLQLGKAHGLAKGDQVLVAVIDSGIDASHPELVGVIADNYDALNSKEPPHAHGTAIAGAIAAHSRLRGVAPSARVLAIRAFGETKGAAEGTTFSILKSLDWAVGKGARVVNMSFAGPKDPALARSLAAAAKKDVILIAAAGNAGAKSPPLYPAADPHVIAVTATDAQDNLFKESNRGNHVAIAAPGVDILLPTIEGGYQVSSGTSFAAAHVSGIAALLVERKRDLDTDSVRKILLATAKDLGPKGKDMYFGAGLADAYRALVSPEAGGPPSPTASAVPATR